MWDHLPLAELRPPARMPEHGVHRNLVHLQCAAAIGQIDRKLTSLHEADPAHYYMGDYDELLERRAALAAQYKRLIA